MINSETRRKVEYRKMHSLSRNSWNKRYIVKFIVLISFLFFILPQFYSIYFRCYNRIGPIGLGDSDIYISRIAYFKDHNIFERPGLFNLTDRYFESSPTEFRKGGECTKYLYLFYGLTPWFLLGKTASLLNISAENMFHYNFYIGIFLMALALYLILKQFGTYPLNLVIGFLIFAVYTGNGSYHGFFWVVPSFYCILLWLITIWVFFFSKAWKIWAPLIVFFLLFSYPLSIFCIAVTVVSVILCGLMENDLACAMKKAGLLLWLLIIYFGGYKILLYKNLILPFFGEGLGLEKMFSFHSGEFGKLWIHTPFKIYFVGRFLPLVAVGLTFCVIRKEYKLLALFSSVFLGLMAFCSINPKGVRLFYYLEIIVLLVISYGIGESILLCWKGLKQLRFRTG